MKSFKAIAASVALLIGASGAALAQPRQHDQGNQGRQETYRTANRSRNYVVSYGDRDEQRVFANDRRTDNDAWNSTASHRYDNDWRKQGRDSDDAWQYRAGEKNQHRVIEPTVRVRQYSHSNVQPRIDSDRDRH